MRRRLLLIPILVVALATLSAPAVFASGPTVVDSWTNEPGELTLTGVCSSFDITVDYVSSGTYTEWDYADGSGMAILHSSEQDTFTANGTSLSGDWYTNTVHVAWDSSGTTTKLVVNGGIEEINLPDGSRFWSAGWLNHLGLTPGIVTPDHGVSGNVAALCAALAP